MDLRHNLITSATGPTILKLAEQKETVKQFRLEGNQLSFKQLEILRFYCDTNCNVGGDFRQLVSRFYANDATVNEAFLSGYLSMGYWKPTSMPIVSYSLKRNTHVVSLMLEFNEINDSQLPALVALVENNTSLRNLSLAQNKLENITPLCDALHVSPITSLDVRSNLLNLDSAKAIAAMLRECDTLTELDISKNPFGRMGLSIIIGVLPMNSGLQTIRCEGPGISAEMVERAQHACTLRYRDIPIQEFPEDIAEREAREAATTAQEREERERRRQKEDEAALEAKMGRRRSRLTTFRADFSF